MCLTRKSLTSAASPTGQPQIRSAPCGPVRENASRFSFINKAIYQAQGSRTIFSSTSLFLALKNVEEETGRDFIWRPYADGGLFRPLRKDTGPTLLTRQSSQQLVFRRSHPCHPAPLLPLPFIVFRKHPQVSPRDRRPANQQNLSQSSGRTYCHHFLVRSDFIASRRQRTGQKGRKLQRLSPKATVTQSSCPCRLIVIIVSFP